MSMASHERSRNRRSSSTVFVLAIWYVPWFLLISTILASTWGACPPMRRERSPLSRQQGKSPILARNIAEGSKKPMATAIHRKERRHFLPSPKGRRVLIPHFEWKEKHPILMYALSISATLSPCTSSTTVSRQ